MMQYVIMAVLVVVGVLHIYGAAIVSWHIAASDYFDHNQKIAQYVIAWCVPVIGTAFIIHILSSDVPWRRPGWIPLLEPLVLAVFGMSFSNSLDAQYGNSDTQDSSHDSVGDSSDGE